LHLKPGAAGRAGRSESASVGPALERRLRYRSGHSRVTGAGWPRAGPVYRAGGRWTAARATGLALCGPRLIFRPA